MPQQVEIGRQQVSVVYDEGLRRYFANVFSVMALGLGVTAAVCMVVSNSPELLSLMTRNVDGKVVVTWTWLGIAAIELALVWKMAGWITDRSVTRMRGSVMFMIYAALNGLTLAPVINAYTAGSSAKAFAIAAATFGACALWGHTTKRDIRPMGAFFFMGLVGMIVALVANIFMQSPAIDFAVSCMGVLIFAGLTAWDMQMLRTFYDEMGESPGLVINGALSLYLDFINFFQLFLRLFGIRTSE